ncbi:MAG: type II toxin-antitoxin system VapC family toxin [Candidatus Latescibacteria bacterium]|nr:type II toxin-antitoxin system VapC family toxin [Candidatus Latescibacterota bacterium]
MRLQRVYVDTSVIGGCHDDEFAPWSNGLMKDFRLGNFRPVVSEVVDAEIRDAPEPIRDIYSELLTLEPEFLNATEEAVQLAETYLERRILTAKFLDDALHIALASVAEVDVLVSWNFKHIVHFDKIRLFTAVNIELGYKPLQIYSPREVTNYGDEKDV